MRIPICLLALLLGACSSTSANPEEPTTCNGVAVNLKTDVGNCGACGAKCTPDVDDIPICDQGVCVAKCPDSDKTCRSGPNAQATCDTFSGCTQKCDYGFRDLDTKCSNGCELQGTGGALANLCSDD
jgi:hypothetical protein